MAKKSGLIVVFFLAGCFFALLNSPRSYAATLTSLSDTISTSRPSAASPLSADNAGAPQLSIFNNGSRYLASDSAKIMKTATGANVATGLIVASQSAALTTVYFTANVSSGLNGADVLIVNNTAFHKVQFTITNPVPASGKIVLTFPGAGSTAASPSASTISFNGLTSGNAATNVSYKLDGTRTCTFTVTAPAITCAVDAGGSLAGGTVITFLIGCTDGSTNETSCTTQAPRFINPTKTASAGTADVWKVNVRTQTSGAVDIDTGTTAIGTVESVEVRATVDATFSFTIAGLANSTAVNTGNSGATQCNNSETTSSGIDSTATLINLGSLPVSSGIAPNISAQLITISTNASNGYSLTATSSGHLQDNASGFAIADSTTPAAFPAATPWFGIHACGADINTGTWGAVTTTTTRGGTAKYGWPTQTTSVSLASRSTGPITGTLPAAGAGLTTVEYAGAVDNSVPSGNFTTSINYVATPIF